MDTGRKGTRWTTAALQHLEAAGATVTHRRQRYDPGDDATIALAGHLLSVEAKDQQRIDLAGWIDQATTQRRAEGAVPVVIAKRRRRSDPGDAYAVLRLDDLIALLVTGPAHPPPP